MRSPVAIIIALAIGLSATLFLAGCVSPATATRKKYDPQFEALEQDYVAHRINAKDYEIRRQVLTAQANRYFAAEEYKAETRRLMAIAAAQGMQNGAAYGAQLQKQNEMNNRPWYDGVRFQPVSPNIQWIGGEPAAEQPRKFAYTPPPGAQTGPQHYRDQTEAPVWNQNAGAGLGPAPDHTIHNPYTYREPVQPNYSGYQATRARNVGHASRGSADDAPDFLGTSSYSPPEVAKLPKAPKAAVYKGW